jgi:5-hydroxyisourate hydrolase-like protein (transthyretin family)
MGGVDRRARMLVTVAVIATLAAALVAAGPGSRAPAFAADATLPGVFITPPQASIVPVDVTEQTTEWTVFIKPSVNSGRPPDDPLVWLDHVDISVDGVLAQTFTGVEGCGTTCPPLGHPTLLTQTFTWNAVGLGPHHITVHVVDSVGSEKTTGWTYVVVNRPVLTLRGVDGAVLPTTVRVPAGSELSFDAEVTNDEPTRTTITSVDLYIDGGQRISPVACSAPNFCAASVVVRQDWGSTVMGVHELRIVATDQWGIQGVATVHVDVFPGTFLLPCYSCSNINLGKTVSLTAQLVRYDTGLGEPGRQVTVQWRPVGVASWQTLATRTTSSTGRLGVVHAPHSNGSYRLTYAGIPDTIGGAVTTVNAIVHPKMKVKLPQLHHFEHRSLAHIKAHTSPAESGAVWYLQRFHFKTERWVTVVKRHIHASHHSTFPLRMPRMGKEWWVRILRPATARYGEKARDFKVFSY